MALGLTSFSRIHSCLRWGEKGPNGKYQSKQGSTICFTRNNKTVEVPLQCPSQETFSLATDERVKRGKETNRFESGHRIHRCQWTQTKNFPKKCTTQQSPLSICFSILCTKATFCDFAWDTFGALSASEKREEKDEGQLHLISPECLPPPPISQVPGGRGL